MLAWSLMVSYLRLTGYLTVSPCQFNIHVFRILKLMPYILVKYDIFLTKISNFLKFCINSSFCDYRMVFYAPDIPRKLVLRLFHSQGRFAMVGDMSCGWGQVGWAASTSWEIIKNVQKWPNINENQWKSMRIHDFWWFLIFTYFTNTFSSPIQTTRTCADGDGGPRKVRCGGGCHANAVRAHGRGLVEEGWMYS